MFMIALEALGHESFSVHEFWSLQGDECSSARLPHRLSSSHDHANTPPLQDHELLLNRRLQCRCAEVQTGVFVRLSMQCMCLSTFGQIGGPTP